MYQDGVVIPPPLSPQVLQHLHAAHQGTSTMEQRARMIVYWPGMTQDIRATRERCADCNRNAPSQALPPPMPSSLPSTPFEAVFADFFTYGGQHYLVVGDRLSGWVQIFGSPSSTNLAGASGLIRHLRSFFATFGVPEEISSDGGPEFTADCTEAFMRHWGIRHRLSSAHFPQSNDRAEVAVKTAKRLLMSNTGPSGSLIMITSCKPCFSGGIHLIRIAAFRRQKLCSAIPYVTCSHLPIDWRNTQTRTSDRSGTKPGK